MKSIMSKMQTTNIHCSLWCWRENLKSLIYTAFIYGHCDSWTDRVQRRLGFRQMNETLKIYSKHKDIYSINILNTQKDK